MKKILELEELAIIIGVICCIIFAIVNYNLEGVCFSESSSSNEMKTIVTYKGKTIQTWNDRINLNTIDSIKKQRTVDGAYLIRLQKAIRE